MMICTTVLRERVDCARGPITRLENATRFYMSIGKIESQSPGSKRGPARFEMSDGRINEGCEEVGQTETETGHGCDDTPP